MKRSNDCLHESTTQIPIFHRTTPYDETISALYNDGTLQMTPFHHQRNSKYQFKTMAKNQTYWTIKINN